MGMRLFDGHCDTISRCCAEGTPWYNGGHLRRNSGQVSLEEAQAAFVGYAQFFALFADTEGLSIEACEQQFRTQYALFAREVAANDDLVLHCTGGAMAEQAVAEGKVAAFLSVEGADLLQCSLERLEEAYRLGVRAVNLTWNHANVLSGSNVEEPERGLSQQGRAFVRRMQELGMLVDVSHLSDPGFWDVVELSEQAGIPFFASHSNCRALCPHPRNLTDDQLRAVIRLGGVVGWNACADFLGQRPTLDTAVAHMEHICALGGERNLAIGGDWDGCTTLDGMERISDVERLYEHLLQRNWKEDTVNALFWGNLMRVVNQVCGM